MQDKRDLMYSITAVLNDELNDAVHDAGRHRGGFRGFVDDKARDMSTESLVKVQEAIRTVVEFLQPY